MKHSLKVGFSFGLISGIITTLGLIVGLHSSTHSRIYIIAGILIIALTDALSDAMGIHISEESENKHSEREIWESTGATFLSKFIFAMSFVVPVLLFTLNAAIVICVGWGGLLVTIFSLFLSRAQPKQRFRIIVEHLALFILVVLLTHYIGDWVGKLH